MLHHMKLQPGPFEMIRSGHKTYELRLLDDKRKNVRIGDMIEFLNLSSNSERIRARVTGLHRFDSFESLYATLPLLQCGYTEDNIAAASPMDMEQYYSREEQAQYGVVAIELELLKDPDSITRTSRYISLVLRHKPEAAGIQLDSHGWASVPELIRGVSRTHPLDMALLERIVAEDEKQRYSFSEDKSKIRANQGHSIPVDVELQELKPPCRLWHGTAEKYVSSIEASGLISKSRLYVHLSGDFDTAVQVGRRHGTPVVYLIDSNRMYLDGHRFYRSENNVWLTDHVPVQYLEKVT